MITSENLIHSRQPIKKEFKSRGFRNISRAAARSLPRRRPSGFVTQSFLLHRRLLIRAENSFPIVLKYQLESTCKLTENQSALSYCLAKSQSCFRTGHPNFPRVYSAAKYFHARKVIPNHCFMFGRNTEKCRRK